MAQELQLQLIVSGTHLSKVHGHTIDQIRHDGFNIDAQVDLGLSEQDSRLDVAHAMSLASKGVADVLAELQPDVLVLLGDRYELLGAASAALIMGVPIFHLHGGETTEGAYDDSIRHAVTKMATWHGVANEEYRKNVISMGEPVDNVFTVGAMALDNIKRMSLLSKSELEQQLNFQLGEKSIIVTFHPVTNANNPIEGFKELLEVLTEREEIHVIFTHPNADHGRAEIVKDIDDFVAKHSKRAMVQASLGQLKFLSALKYVNAMVGNSSSGIIEAPSMMIPSLNIGDRQKGRHRASTIIDCGNDRHNIAKGLSHVLAFDLPSSTDSPYSSGNPAKTVVGILKH